VVLEIGRDSLYHSGLALRPEGRSAWKPSKNQVITNMKIVASAVTLLLAALVAQPALAEGDVEAGKQLAYTCLGCHGIEGYRNAYPSFRVPKLGGQKATYLEVALKGYRAGTREHPTMQGQAMSLSDQEIQDVAAYLSSINDDSVAAGGTQGASFDKAAACAACHGQNGISVNAMWPTLAGQHEDYLVHAIRQYKAGARKDPVMSAQAAMIAEEDIPLLAAYFASLEGLDTTRPE
jgi:cytochrome c553